MADLLLFCLTVRRARERGLRVAVASFGKKEVIQKYLGFMLPNDPPILVLTCADLAGHHEGTRVPNGKPRMLNLLWDAAPGRYGNGRVLFFDDTAANVENCRFTT